MKLITFSLWGTSLKYLVGAIRNAELAKEVYPDWICRYYVASSVPFGYVHKLKSFDNVEVVGNLSPGGGGVYMIDSNPKFINY